MRGLGKFWVYVRLSAFSQGRVLGQKTVFGFRSTWMLDELADPIFMSPATQMEMTLRICQTEGSDKRIWKLRTPVLKAKEMVRMQSLRINLNEVSSSAYGEHCLHDDVVGRAEEDASRLKSGTLKQVCMILLASSLYLRGLGLLFLAWTLFAGHQYQSQPGPLCKNPYCNPFLGFQPIHLNPQPSPSKP